MDNYVTLLFENNDLLKQIYEIVSNSGRNDDVTLNPPFRIAKGKKEAFLIVMWAMYVNGMFVKADSSEDEEKQAKSLKSVMDWLSIPFDTTYNNPFQILNDIFSREDCIQVCYDLLNTVSSEYHKRLRK